MINVINQLFSVEALKDTIRRFPFSVFCAFCLFIIAILNVNEIIDLEDETLGRGAASLSSLYLWFGITKLISESRRTPVSLDIVVSMVGAAALVALFAFSSLYWIHYLLVLPALLLGIVIAPYLFGGDDWSFWQFNRKLWLGVALSMLVVFLFSCGLSLALAAIDHLFGVDVDEKLYADIGIFSSAILGPVYALSRVPKRFTFSKEEGIIPPGLRFIANWISVPIVFLYLLILYAYFIKIIVTGEMPSGHLAVMITGFVGSGVITYLIGWPLYKSGEGLPQLNLFYKIFFPALFVPVGFHFFAIWERIGAYGITEQRYVLMVSAFWFLIIAIAKSLPYIPLKIIPASLCVLLALSSFGPWGAVSVSGHSQSMFLKRLLTKYELLENGKVVKLREGEKISLEDRVSISSILGYLCNTDRDHMVEPWFNVKSEKSWSCLPSNMTRQLGFEYIYYRSADSYNDAYFNVSSHYSEGKPVIDVRSYDYLVRDFSGYIHSLNDNKPWEQNVKIDGQYELKLFFNGSELRITVDEHEAIIVDLVEYLEDKAGINHEVENMYISGENSELSYKVIFHSINGEMRKGEPFPQGVTFDFLFKVKE